MMTDLIKLCQNNSPINLKFIKQQNPVKMSTKLQTTSPKKKPVKSV